MFTLTPARTAVPLRQQEAGARTSLLVGGIPTLICGLLALPVLARIDPARPRGRVLEYAGRLGFA